MRGRGATVRRPNDPAASHHLSGKNRAHDTTAGGAMDAAWQEGMTATRRTGPHGHHHEAFTGTRDTYFLTASTAFTQPDTDAVCTLMKPFLSAPTTTSS